MKIAIIADPVDNQSAGIHTYTRNLVESLRKAGGEHELYLILQQHHPEWPETHQIILSNTRLPIGWASLRLFFLVPRALRKRRVDVVIEPAHFGPFNLPKKTKRVTVIHDLTPILFPHHHRWHSRVLQKLFLRRILRKADLVVSNSNSTQADIEACYPFTQNKIKTIHLGRDTFFTHSTSTETLKKFGIDQPYFLYAGTIEPRKNLALQLDAFAGCCDREGANFQLVIAGGKGWKSREFYKKYRHHPHKDKIILTGYVTKAELRALYSDAIALVYPSVYEGFGLPVLEAMSCGTPCILQQSSSLPEVGGSACLYFHNNDSGQLANHMHTLITNKQLRQSLADEALQQAARFSWDNYAAELIQVLEDIVTKK